MEEWNTGRMEESHMDWMRATFFHHSNTPSALCFLCVLFCLILRNYEAGKVAVS